MWTFVFNSGHSDRNRVKLQKWTFLETEKSKFNKNYFWNLWRKKVCDTLHHQLYFRRKKIGHFLWNFVIADVQRFKIQFSGGNTLKNPSPSKI